WSLTSSTISASVNGPRQRYVTPSETNCGRTAGEAKNNQITQLRPCPSGYIREHWPTRRPSPSDRLNVSGARHWVPPSWRPGLRDSGVIRLASMAELLLFPHAQGQPAGFLAFADELRAAGHVVHAPDLYEGKTFAHVADGVRYAEEVGF